MRLSHQFPIIVLGVHSLAVILMAILIATQLTDYPESVMLWNLFMVIDFPISFSFSLLPEAWFAGIPNEVEYVYIYAAIFGVFGGLQYIVVSYLLQFLIRSSFNPNSDSSTKS